MTSGILKLRGPEIWLVRATSGIACAVALFAAAPAAAQSPSAPAEQVALATRYRQGDGVPRDYKEARRLYELAAAQKDGSALRLLGDMEAAGEGRRHLDRDRALELWEEASAAGDPHAAIQVADNLFERATGARAPTGPSFNIRTSRPFDAKKMTEVARWYLTAAKQDDRADVSGRALSNARLIATLMRAMGTVEQKIREHELPHEVP